MLGSVSQTNSKENSWANRHGCDRPVSPPTGNRIPRHRLPHQFPVHIHRPEYAEESPQSVLDAPGRMVDGRLAGTVRGVHRHTGIHSRPVTARGWGNGICTCSASPWRATGGRSRFCPCCLAPGASCYGYWAASSTIGPGSSPSPMFSSCNSSSAHWALPSDTSPCF